MAIGFLRNTGKDPPPEAIGPLGSNGFSREVGVVWPSMKNVDDKTNKSAAGMQHTPPRDIFNAKQIISKQGL